jgi:hypothetical protein
MENQLFLEFLFKRIDTKLGDLKEAGNHDDVEIFVNDLEDYIEGLKHATGFEAKA